MNKTDFVNRLADQTDIPKYKAIEITNAMFEIITEGLKRQENIQFIEFGSFEARHTPE